MSGSFRASANTESITTFWDFLMADFTCTPFGFASLVATKTALTTPALITTVPVTFKVYPINQVIGDATAASISSVATSIKRNLYTLCNTDSLIFASTLTTQSVDTSSSLSSTQ